MLPVLIEAYLLLLLIKLVMTITDNPQPQTKSLIRNLDACLIVVTCIVLRYAAFCCPYGASQLSLQHAMINLLQALHTPHTRIFHTKLTQ